MANKSQWAWHNAMFQANKLSPDKHEINWIYGAPGTGKTWIASRCLNPKDKRIRGTALIDELLDAVADEKSPANLFVHGGQVTWPHAQFLSQLVETRPKNRPRVVYILYNTPPMLTASTESHVRVFRINETTRGLDEVVTKKKRKASAAAEAPKIVPKFSIASALADDQAPVPPPPPARLPRGDKKRASEGVSQEIVEAAKRSGRSYGDELRLLAMKEAEKYRHQTKPTQRRSGACFAAMRHGKCSKEETCIWNHDPKVVEEAKAANKKKRIERDVCPAFLNGKCKYGDSCYLRHEARDEMAAAAAAAEEEPATKKIKR